MTFYWRQTIVGLLHHAAGNVPGLAERAEALAGRLNTHLTATKLEEAFSLFQEVTLQTHDPVYVTGAFYAMQALKEAERWEKQAAGAADLDAILSPGLDEIPILGPEEPNISAADPGARSPEPGEAGSTGRPDSPPGTLGALADGGAPAETTSDEAALEVEHGLLEVFDRIRAGATLEQALALFPLRGEETNPQD
jgi:hypothetical protein